MNKQKNPINIDEDILHNLTHFVERFRRNDNFPFGRSERTSQAGEEK